MSNKGAPSRVLVGRVELLVELVCYTVCKGNVEQARNGGIGATSLEGRGTNTD